MNEIDQTSFLNAIKAMYRFPHLEPSIDQDENMINYYIKLLNVLLSYKLKPIKENTEKDNYDLGTFTENELALVKDAIKKLSIPIDSKNVGDFKGY